MLSLKVRHAKPFNEQTVYVPVQIETILQTLCNNPKTILRNKRKTLYSSLMMQTWLMRMQQHSDANP